MPIRDEVNKKWLCEECRTIWPFKRDAKKCEKTHEMWKSWARDEITTEDLAEYLEIDPDSIRDMTRGGHDPTLSEKIAGERTLFQGGMGTLVNITQLHSNGRTQVPFQIRNEMGVQDGDPIYWYRSPDGRYYIDHRQITDDFPVGKQIRVAR